jgi:hypothetical protein
VRYAVQQCDEALCFLREGGGFDSRWGLWVFLIDLILSATLWLGVDSVSNRNYYQGYSLGGKYGRCVGLTTLPPSCTVVWKFWEPQPSGALRTYLDLFRVRFISLPFSLWNNYERIFSDYSRTSRSSDWHSLLILDVRGSNFGRTSSILTGYHGSFLCFQAKFGIVPQNMGPGVA